MNNEHAPDSNHGDSNHGDGTVPPAPTATMAPPPVPNPAAPTHRPNPARRALVVLGIAALAFGGTILAAIVLLIGLAIGAVVGFAIETDVQAITHTPDSIGEIPTAIVAEQAEVVIDLSELGTVDFETRTEPLPIEVDVDFGSVEVIVPEGLDISVNADTDIGSTSVFDRIEDGFDNRVIVDGSDDPDVELTIDLDVGDIDVERS